MWGRARSHMVRDASKILKSAVVVGEILFGLRSRPDQQHGVASEQRIHVGFGWREAVKVSFPIPVHPTVGHRLKRDVGADRQQNGRVADELCHRRIRGVSPAAICPTTGRWNRSGRSWALRPPASPGCLPC